MTRWEIAKLVDPLEKTSQVGRQTEAWTQTDTHTHTYIQADRRNMRRGQRVRERGEGGEGDVLRNEIDR